MPVRKKTSSVPPFTELNELCSQRNGGSILFATDDWFAPAENMLCDQEPEFRAHLYTECGKWMDGWETRRRRSPGHDWCLIQLGVPGIIHGVHVDTAFFTGNHAPRYSLQAARLSQLEKQIFPPRSGDMLGKACGQLDMEKISLLKSEQWEEIVPMTMLSPGYEPTRHNYAEVKSTKTWTHLRLNIYPDGGIARLHIYGETRPSETTGAERVLDLVSMLNGGICKGYSNAHFGHPRNLIRPDQGKDMGDGWETARRLDRPPVIQVKETGEVDVPGFEWATFRLGFPGMINKVEIDTKHFKGNFPDSVKLEGALIAPSREWNGVTLRQCEWKTIIPHTKMNPDKNHEFPQSDLACRGPFSHVKITIAPDGGVSRLRIFGVKFDPNRQQVQC